mmetsp:Transcript_19558/g.43574  ORF Transcript_19558/g.43574 Transcript_19558/m.43574 type:complete len:100 (+) Transcript_19558:88-387(+)
MISKRRLIVTLLLCAALPLAAADRKPRTYCKVGDTRRECMGQSDEDPIHTLGCVDEHSRCEEWANAGKCTEHKGHMLQFCRLSCKVCTPDTDDEVKDEL